tara:strand:- start:868 stop:1572 length:705 start_codon:yes stop_codon:yes gene_type:complete
MAGEGYKTIGKAKRGMISRQRKADLASNMISGLGSLAIYGAGKIKESKSAWDNYEEAYKGLGGQDPIERPKFGQKGFFTGPSGQVNISGKIYDSSDITKAGKFLKSDAANLLSDKSKKEYLGRVSFEDKTAEYGEEMNELKKSLVSKQFSKDYDVDEEFGFDAWTAESPVYQPGQEPELMTAGENWETPRPIGIENIRTGLKDIASNISSEYGKSLYDAELQDFRSKLNKRLGR